MKLIVVRHGETTENSLNICQGQQEGTLSENGIRQNDVLALKLKDEGIDVFYTSPLNRAHKTAEQLYAYHKSAPFKVDKRLMEWYLGDFEGKPFPQNFSVLDIESGIESFNEVKSRVLSFIEEIKIKHKNQTVLMVCHGLTIKVLSHILSGESFNDIAVPLNSSEKIFLVDQKSK